MFSTIRRFFRYRFETSLEKIYEISSLAAVRSGLVLTLPLVMLGCLVTLINNFPLDVYVNGMNSVFGSGWRGFMEAVYNGTTGVVSLLLLVSIGPHMAAHYNNKHILTPVNPAITGLTALGSLMTLIQPASISGLMMLPSRWMGVSGLFIAIIVAVGSAKVFIKLSSLRSLRLNLSSGSADYSIPQAFNALLPAGMTVLLFAAMGVLARHIWGVSVHEVFHDFLRMPFETTGDNVWRGLLYTLSLHILWFFGIHGANVLDPITHSVYGAFAEANSAAFSAGMPLPHIMTKEFLDIYVFMGGSGATLCLALALLLVGKARNQRRLSFVALTTGVFNINEILIFGLPVVLNPVMLVPFILCPLVLTVIAYVAVTLGIAPGPHMQVQWTTPIFLNAHISTGSIFGPILQLFNLAVGICVYAPFVMISDTMYGKRTSNAFSNLLHRYLNNNTPTLIVNSPDSAGSLARNLLTDLEQSLNTRRGVFMEYQPKVTAHDNRVCGVEALFRWNHPVLGLIPPPISIGLAEESGLIHRLGRFALEEACATGRDWLDNGLRDISIAVNVSAHQLTPDMIPTVRELLHFYTLPHHMLELEVTESSALAPDSPESKVLRGLHMLGLRLAIDDFGMGHSSLKYLKEFPVDVIKIDGAITREITFNPICADIVSSITRLCRARNITSVAEFVENAEQVATLAERDCDVYQGYYFSKPLKADQCLEYIMSRRTCL